MHGVGSANLLAAPSGSTDLPAFQRGWLTPDGERTAFLSYVELDPSVNWSDELELLHEEASRTHFLDRWTRSALLSGIGSLPEDVAIADVGCSTGFLLQDLRARHARATLIGVDLISSGLVKAHELVPDARLLRADACELPIGDGTLDAAVTANLLEHVPDDRQALRELARVLRPGGRVGIVVPAGPSTYDYYDRFLGHERRYGRREMADKCRGAGLEVLSDTFIGALLYPPFWLVKQRNRRRFGHLEGAALQDRVAGDILRTRDSPVGELAWRIERSLARRGVKLPFGIRSLVIARRPTTR